MASGRHSTRDARGRWSKTASGAPIPHGEGIAPEGDTGAFDNVDDISGRPGADSGANDVFGHPYPACAFTHAEDGSYSPLRGRRPVQVDAQTGEALDARITDVRASKYVNGGDGPYAVRPVQYADEAGSFYDAEQPPPAPRKYLPRMGQSDVDASLG